MTSVREEIVKAANHYSPKFGKVGSFVDTSGEWCSTQNPEEFRKFLEDSGFEVISCKAQGGSTAVAITSDGYHISWNGYCRLITDN